jgi:hypothetical protein
MMSAFTLLSGAASAAPYEVAPLWIVDAVVGADSLDERSSKPALDSLSAQESLSLPGERPRRQESAERLHASSRARASSGFESESPKGWSVTTRSSKRPKDGMAASDSLYRSLLAVPLDSLSAREYQWLLNEQAARSSRVPLERESEGSTGGAVIAGVLLTLMFTALMFRGGWWLWWGS